MNRLKELYDGKEDIIFDDIPDGWRENFNRFMTGQTCWRNDEGQFVAFHWDFRQWYNINREAIEREIKIDEISK